MSFGPIQRQEDLANYLFEMAQGLRQAIVNLNGGLRLPEVTMDGAGAAGSGTHALTFMGQMWRIPPH